MKDYKTERVGKEFNTPYGKIIILEYLNANNATIQFVNDGTILTNVKFSTIKSGEIKNPNFKSKFGVGYLGQGVYNLVNSKKAYFTWANMLARCYKETSRHLAPTYKDVTVCEEWHNFQNFAKWFEENSIAGYHLDKDILCKNCKIYSPETCCFVPREVNNLILNGRYSKKINSCIGVQERNGKYKVRARLTGGEKYLGFFESKETAKNVYIEAREKYIKEVAEKWKGKIADNVYQSLINYKIDTL